MLDYLHHIIYVSGSSLSHIMSTRYVLCIHILDTHNSLLICALTETEIRSCSRGGQSNEPTDEHHGPPELPGPRQ